MNRRSFLYASSAGAGLLSFSALGCGSVRKVSASGAAGSGFRYQVNERHFVYDQDSVAFELAPSAHRINVLGDKFTILRESSASIDEINYPHCGETDGSGRMYFLQAGGGGVGVMDAASGTVSKSAQGGSELVTGTDLVLHQDGNLYACDSSAHRIVVFDKQGNQRHSFGKHGQGAGELNGPRGIAVDSEGNLHVVDGGNARIAVYGPKGKSKGSYGGYGREEGAFLSPRSIAIDAGRVCVADPASGYVSIFGEDGSYRRRFVPLHEDGDPAAPLELSFDHEGVLQIWSNGHNSVHVVG